MIEEILGLEEKELPEYPTDASDCEYCQPDSEWCYCALEGLAYGQTCPACQRTWPTKEELGYCHFHGGTGAARLRCPDCSYEPTWQC